MPSDAAFIRRFTGGVLFLSGAAALVDEHLLSRLMVRVVGSSAEAVAAVLVAFMGGMGLGAHLAARRVCKARRPLLTYAVVELCIAILALAVPFFLWLVTHAYAALASRVEGSAVLMLLRFVLSIGVLSLPGIAMGATFPLLLEAVSRRLDRELPVALFYSTNTLGAAFGVLLSTYLLLPWLGLLGTLLSSASLNVAIALLCLVLARMPVLRGVTPAGSEAVGTPPLALSPRRGLVIAFGSGYLAFAVEVLCFRLLASIVGNSVYAFGLMLFVFLLGNAIGSQLATLRRLAHPLALGLLQSAVGLALLCGLPLWDLVPAAFDGVGAYRPSFLLWEGTRFTIILALLLVPTFLMGSAFAVLLRLAGGEGREGARRVGQLYAANMAGAILGATSATFLLAPHLGSEVALLLVAVGEVVLGLVALTPATGSQRFRLVVAALLTALVGGWVRVIEPWNMASLLSGANVYFSGGFADYDKLLFLEEDRSGGMVAVVEKAGQRTLLANGKFEGNDGFEVPDQLLFSLLPVLFVRQHREALNIGVGTACSLSAIGAFPFQRIDAVDVSSAVIEAARHHFARLNGGVLDDPRVHVIIEDGRNFLLRSRKRYDLVAMQLSSIWISGTADLYNREFYQLVSRHLAPGGVFKQWLQLHHIQQSDIARVIATARAVFPHVTLWVGGHQGILVASPDRLRADVRAIAAWQQQPRVRGLLERAGLLHPFAAFGHLYLDEQGIDSLLADLQASTGLSPAQMISDDDHPTLEFSTPRGNLLPDALQQNMRLARRHATASPLAYIEGLANASERDLFLTYVAQERQFTRVARWISKQIPPQILSRHPRLQQALDAGRNAPWP